MKGFSLNKNKILGVLGLLLVWSLSYSLIGNSVILPSPSETLEAFKEIISSPNFTLTIINTFLRIIVSFIISLALAFVLGVLAAMNQWFYDFLSPLVSLFKIVPTMAIVILALIWLTNKKAPILIAVIVIFPILYQAVIEGIKSIDKDILGMVQVYRVKTIDIIKKIYIPSIVKSILAIFSSALGLCLKIVIGGEVLGQPLNSIGSSIQTEKMYLNTAGVLAWIGVLVIISLVTEGFSKLLTYKLDKSKKGY